MLTALLGLAIALTVNRIVGISLKLGPDKQAVSDISIEEQRQELLSSGVFHDGVFVNGIPIGGMTYTEAKSALEPFEKNLTKGKLIKLKYGNGEVKKLGRSYFEFNYNTDSILEEAILIGNTGDNEQVSLPLSQLTKVGKNYTITCREFPDIKKIKETVTDLGKSLNKEPKNATCTPNPDSVYDGSDRFIYEKGVKGYKARVSETIDEILTRIARKDYGTVEMKGDSIDPEIKLSDLKGKIVLRARYRSSYGHPPYDAPNRVFNIQKACGIVNGTVLPTKKAGGSKYIFSANDTLGPRTEEGGWLPAPGFINNGANSVDSPGGGVCHVSSTLYNAVIRADLEIVYRINHSSHVGYVPWGLDATIDSRGPDFKFANNTDSDLYIFMWVNTDKQTVNCEIWGEPFPDEFDKIDFYAELVEEIPPTETQYIVDSNLSAPYWYEKNPEKTGYRYQSYKQYLKDGEPVGDPIPVALSLYKMHPLRLCVWPGFNKDHDVLLPEYQLYTEDEET